MTDDAPSRTAAPLWVLVALQTGISAAGLVVEIVAARMIAPYVGMSLYSWTAIIAVVLAGFSIGHWWGGRLGAAPSQAALVRTGWIMLAAAAFTAAASLILRLAAGPVLQGVSNPMLAITLIAALAFFLPSLFAGVPAPVLAVVAMRGRGQAEHALGLMFAAGAFGAIVGTLLAGFVFISWLGSIATLFVITAFYVLAAVILLTLARVGRGMAIAALIGIVITSLMGWRVLAAPQICDVESSYYCIRTVSLTEDRDNPIRLMVIDHLAHGIGAEQAPRVMYTDHTAMLDALPRMRMGSDSFRSFHIGGGTYSVPRAWADRGHTDITVSEVDPAVTEQAVRNFWFDPATATILHQDARAGLRQSDRRFDVIIGDAFTDIAVPPHLVTKEFFQLVQSRLNEDGVFAMNLVDNVDTLEALAALYQTLNRVFPSVEVWTEALPPQPGERRVFVLLASETDSPVSLIETQTPELKRFSPLAEAYVRSIVEQANSPVLTDDYAPIDRLMGLGSVID